MTFAIVPLMPKKAEFPEIKESILPEAYPLEGMNWSKKFPWNIIKSKGILGGPCSPGSYQYIWNKVLNLSDVNSINNLIMNHLMTYVLIQENYSTINYEL